MGWEKVKQVGYGLLRLSPNELFNLTPVEFFDMYNARVHYQNIEEDREYQRTAWFTSLIMTSSGNYKDGIKPKELYEPQYNADGSSIEGSTSAPITKEQRDELAKELLEKFNTINSKTGAAKVE
ncbi:phage tail assembly chaperone [Bacillus thuringiensis]|uniref:phage tail assembly chaperone n=1 Tax=Bacillus thuringiensis TaxID=1428 RepID=UPI00345919BA